ncbi:hypothetical protein [Bradyrhizobium diazoefficiens]|uniref:hypothetical protein n=1 Tax=Bradyrhizobium diazoefficiens TaxID=1355477 RepID=UPI0013A54032|nr:hypothetical protein [Bradyrhizobium diazoefficiens]QJS41059.1 hypothetical protein DI395_46335 [Bradyrhizobium diazoefficiens]
MSAIRFVARHLVPSEKQVLQLYHWFIPGNAPKWLEPSLWLAIVVLLLALYGLIVR